MAYDQFVDALEVLGLKKFPDVAKPPMALERLLQDHVLPYAARKGPEEDEFEGLLVPELMDIFRCSPFLTLICRLKRNQTPALTLTDHIQALQTAFTGHFHVLLCPE